MHQTRRNAFWKPAVLILFLLVFFSAAGVPDDARAEQGRGEHFITGKSLSDFNGVGHIDRVEGDQLVIDDCSRSLSSGAEYYKPGPVKIPRAAFSPGSRVGYIENQKGQIISLWLLPGK